MDKLLAAQALYPDPTLLEIPAWIICVDRFQAIDRRQGKLQPIIITCLQQVIRLTSVRRSRPDEAQLDNKA